MQVGHEVLGGLVLSSGRPPAWIGSRGLALSYVLGAREWLPPHLGVILRSARRRRGPLPSTGFSLMPLPRESV